MSKCECATCLSYKVAALEKLLAAADKVCEYAYHSTLDGCGFRDKDNCECGLTKAQNAYQALKGKT